MVKDEQTISIACLAGGGKFFLKGVEVRGARASRILPWSENFPRKKYFSPDESREVLDFARA
jgi:hypothetical protein